MAEIKEIPVEEIKVGPHDQRLAMNDEAINDLLCSIRRVGIIVPLVVCPGDDGYVVVAGHRRFRAAQLCNLKTVPAIVRENGESEIREISFAENFFRADLSAVEQAAAIKDVLDTGGLTVEQLAAGFHRSEHWVNRQLELLRWPEDVLEGVHRGWFSVAAAANLALINEPIYREFLIKNAADSGATARTTAAWLQSYRSMQPPQEAILAEPVGPEGHPLPAVPQAPCICCGQVFRTDELSHVPACASCIRVIREVGTSRS